jgi:hypothetical protein
LDKCAQNSPKYPKKQDKKRKHQLKRKNITPYAPLLPKIPRNLKLYTVLRGAL